MELANKYEYLKNIDSLPKSVTFPEEFKGIQNFKFFICKYEKSVNNSKIEAKAIRILDFLYRIQEQITNGSDPIEYLYNLYYNIKISTTDISNELRYLWNINGKTTYDFINKIFNEKFEWELRDVNERTPLRDEKDRTKNGELKIVAKNEKIAITNKVESILTRISRDKEKTEYSTEVYSRLKFALKQSKYILSINGYINEENFEDTLIKLSNKYGLKVTAIAVSNIVGMELNNVGVEKSFSLNPGRLVELKKSR